MNTKIKILWTVVISILSACCLFMTIEYESTIELSLDSNMCDAKSVRFGYSFESTRIKNAIDDITIGRSKRDLVDKYIKMHPSCAIDKAQALLANVQIELKYNGVPVAVIKSVARTRNEAEVVSDFFAQHIIAYFADEIRKRKEKINAWFDQQIYHKRKKGETIVGLEEARQKVLMEKHEGDVKLEKRDCCTVIRIKSRF